MKKFGQYEVLRGIELAVPGGRDLCAGGRERRGQDDHDQDADEYSAADGGCGRSAGRGIANAGEKHFHASGTCRRIRNCRSGCGWARCWIFCGRFTRRGTASWRQELVRQFDLPLDRKLKHLSRGMRMKAAFAGSLAYRPKLIVLDEPFTGLDPLVRDELIEGLLERAGESTILLSSHDLAEIESFASHIGYLEEGQMRFSEELTTLVERFREVELTFDTPPHLPKTAPNTWMHLSTSAAVIRFIESRFDAEKTTTEVRNVLGEARNVAFTPMSLRSIFLAMAKAGRDPYVEGAER